MKKKWDKFGITLSSLCLVHCICIVFLPLLFPVLISFIHNIWVHIIFVLFVLGLIPLAFIPGFRIHKSSTVLIIAFVAIIFLLSGILSEAYVAEWISHGLSIIGSVLIMTAHFQNIRLQRKCC